jgi:hypothetical protein
VLTLTVPGLRSKNFNQLRHFGPLQLLFLDLIENYSAFQKF